MKTNSKPFLFNYKEALCKIFDKFIEEGEIQSGSSVFYDILKESGSINPTNKEVLEACHKAKVLLLKKDAEQPEKLRKPFLYQSNHNLIVKCKAKVLILEDIFSKIDAEGKHIKNYLI